MQKLNVKRMWVLLFLTIVVAALVFCVDSFRDDEFSKYADTPYYSSIAQNIVQTGDWVNLRDYRGNPFENDHPPLNFWATALSFKMFGESAFSAVLFSLLCATITCIAVFFIGTILKNDIAGFLSAMGLLLTRYVPRVARYNTIEIPLMCFITLAVLFLILAQKKHRSYYLLFGISTGLAILTKGVVGFFPIGICLITILLQKKFKDLWNPFFLASFLIIFSVPGVWFFVKGGMSFESMGSILSGYMDFVMATFKASGRGDPGTRLRFITRLGEFCFIIIPGVILGIYYIVKDNLKGKSRELLVVPLWAILFITAYLISSWRRGFYLLPMYPAMAVLFGVGLYRAIPKNYHIRVVIVLFFFFAGNIAAPFLFPHWEPKTVQEVVFKNRYLSKAKRALNVLNGQAGTDLKLIAYKQDSESTFYFFFNTDYNIDYSRTVEELEKQVFSEEPLLFYIQKVKFSRLDKKLQDKLKIVYAFDKQLILTNKIDLVSVFDKADSK